MSFNNTNCTQPIIPGLQAFLVIHEFPTITTSSKGQYILQRDPKVMEFISETTILTTQKQLQNSPPLNANIK